MAKSGQDFVNRLAYSKSYSDRARPSTKAKQLADGEGQVSYRQDANESHRATNLKVTHRFDAFTDLLPLLSGRFYCDLARLTCQRQLGRGWVSLQRKKQETERQSKARAEPARHRVRADARSCGSGEACACQRALDSPRIFGVVVLLPSLKHLEL